MGLNGLVGPATASNPLATGPSLLVLPSSRLYFSSYPQEGVRERAIKKYLYNLIVTVATAQLEGSVIVGLQLSGL